MAIRIIKQRTDSLSKPMRVKCPGCTSTIEFTREDAKLVYDQRDGSYYEIQCPCCPRRITKTPEKVYV